MTTLNGQTFDGMSAREVYEAQCERFGCKCNSQMLKTLPTEPDVFDSLEIDLSMNMVGTKGLLPVLEVIRIRYLGTNFERRRGFDISHTLRELKYCCKWGLKHELWVYLD